MLGDLVLFVDYADHSQGIMGDLFGAEAVAEFVRLRTAGRFDQARTYSRGLWASLGESRTDRITAAIRSQYAELFAAMPTPAYLT